jgi:hypothetical protein
MAAPVSSGENPFTPEKLSNYERRMMKDEGRKREDRRPGT